MARPMAHGPWYLRGPPEASLCYAHSWLLYHLCGCKFEFAFDCGVGAIGLVVPFPFPFDLFVLKLYPFFSFELNRFEFSA